MRRVTAASVVPTRHAIEKIDNGNEKSEVDALFQLQVRLKHPTENLLTFEFCQALRPGTSPFLNHLSTPSLQR